MDGCWCVLNQCKQRSLTILLHSARCLQNNLKFFINSLLYYLNTDVRAHSIHKVKEWKCLILSLHTFHFYFLCEMVDYCTSSNPIWRKITWIHHSGGLWKGIYWLYRQCLWEMFPWKWRFDSISEIDLFYMQYVCRLCGKTTSFGVGSLCDCEVVYYFYSIRFYSIQFYFILFYSILIN